MDFSNSFEFNQALAQVVVESEPLAEDIFVDNYSNADPSSSLFLWFLFAVSFVSFIIFWFNREYLLLFIRKEKQEINYEKLSDDRYDEFGDKTTAHPEEAQINLNVNKAGAINDSDKMSLNDQELSVHDVEVEQDEYKKPKLKLIMEEGEPKLVFD